MSAALPQRYPPARSLESQVRSLDPALQPDSPEFQAALVLFAAARVGQNIDRISRKAGVPRNFVAQCARRLVDNGVWRNGSMLRAWADDGSPAEPFWNDVAVALGRLCRRLDEHGMLEWAAPGEWHKEYDFLAPPAAETAVRYHRPEVTPLSAEEEAALAATRGAEAWDAQTPRLMHRPHRMLRRTWPRRRRRPLPAAPAVPLRGDYAPPPPEPRAPQRPPPEIFPNADWLI